MNIQATVMNAVRGYLESAKRSAIAYSICALCGLAVLILATGAGVMALIPLVGAIYAQLIVAGVFLAVIAATLLWVQRSARPDRPARPVQATAETAPSQVQFAQIAMILEALMLGYSMSRRRR
jgi:predicted lipid-binding transport protein (Tim44 family)